MRRAILTVAMVGVLCLVTTGLEAGIVAQTGFNDAKGINPSDYTSGGGLHGKGAGEPGWTNNWTIATTHQPWYTTTTSPKSEGDLSLKIANNLGTTVLANRNYAPQTGVFYVDTMALSTSSLTSHGLIMYSRQASDNGVASMMNIGPGGLVRVSDQGASDGSYIWVDTGQTWTANRWVRFTQEIDVPNQTYNAWINGHPVDPGAGNSLNFRHNSVSTVDNLQLFLPNQASTTRSIRVDSFRVLTHNPLEAYPITTGFSGADYVAGQSIIGKGSGEPNWTSNWEYYTGRTRGTATIATVGGDPALRIMSDPDIMIHREYENQSRPFFLDFDVRVGDNPGDDLQGGNAQGLHIYAGNPGATAFNICFDGNYNILARDGDGANGGPLLDTGFNWKPGQWVHVTAAINPYAETYELWINTSKYNPLDPLGFRGTTPYVGDIKFLLQDQTPNGVPVYIDNIRVTLPEPATLVLLGAGLAFTALRRRKRV